jgi:fucose permease
MARPSLFVLVLAFAGFVVFGLAESVLGVAWPSLRDGFGVSQSALGMVLTSTMVGAFGAGVWSEGLLRWLGVGRHLAFSSGIASLALLGYACAPAWGLFVPLGVLLGFGLGSIDAGLNSYAARHFSLRQVNWLHACWGIGAALGPILMTLVIALGLGYRVGYFVLAATLGAMGVTFVVTWRAWGVRGSTARDASASSFRPSIWDALLSGPMWLQLVTFFAYTGLETTLGQWCYTVMREGRGASVEVAGSWTASYWASLTVGRVVLGAIIDRVGADRLVRSCLVLAVVGATVFAVDWGGLGAIGLLFAGLGLAPVFPTLMARTPARVGEALSSQAVGLQISAATLGSALVPAGVGLLVPTGGLELVGKAAVGAALVLFVLHECLCRWATHPTRAPESA